MLFNSFEYFILLMVTVTLYWLSPSQTVRKIILLISSAIFYMSWNAALILLLLSIGMLNWICAILQKRFQKNSYTYFAVIITLLVLGYFKYSQFVLNSFEHLAQVFHLNYTAPRLNIILPLGISFYSFQIIAYTIDAKDKKFEVDKNPFDVMLFILFFPHLIAGPICFHNNLLVQLQKKISFSWQHIFDGLALIAMGLFLKVTFADGIAPFVDKVFAAPGAFTPGSTFQAVVGYTIQILGDFWGYSTMAVGSSLMFGISIPMNFNLPYSSKSLQDFWRRWHITLSSWLRDYLYIRIGGSRHGEWITHRNLMITMVVGGLWHGANWTFVIWGAIHGSALVVERILSKKLPDVLGALPRLKSVFQWFYTMCIVVAAWVFFRAQDVTTALSVLKTITTSSLHIFRFDRTDASFMLILTFIPLHLLLHQQITKTLNTKRNLINLASLSLLLLFLSIIFSSDDVQKFIYFEF